MAIIATAVAAWASAAPSARAATTVATSGTVTATAGSTVALPGWRVRGATDSTILVTISTSAGSLRLGSVSGMTAAAGYTLPSAATNFWP